MLIDIGKRELAKSGQDQRHRPAGDRRGHQAAQRVGGQERGRLGRPALRRLPEELAAPGERLAVGRRLVPGRRRATAPTPRRGGSRRCRPARSAADPPGHQPAGRSRAAVLVGVVGDRLRPATAGLLPRTRRWPAPSPRPAIRSTYSRTRRWPRCSPPPADGDVLWLAGRRRGRVVPDGAGDRARRPRPPGRGGGPARVVRRARGAAARPGGRDGPAAHRVPVGPRADPPLAGEVPAGGDLRDARGDRHRRLRRTSARSSATCCCRCTSTPGSRAEADEDGFTIDDVAGGIVDKLVHRHPHVFAGLDVADADEVERNWDDAQGRREGPQPRCSTGIPAALPALALADKVLGRAAKVGVAPAARRPETGRPRPGGPAARPRRRGARRRAATPSRRCATPYAGSATGSAPPSPIVRDAVSPAREPAERG